MSQSRVDPILAVTHLEPARNHYARSGPWRPRLDRQFAALYEVPGDRDVAADPRFTTNPERVAHRAELRVALEGHLARRPAAEWPAARGRKMLLLFPVRRRASWSSQPCPQWIVHVV